MTRCAFGCKAPAIGTAEIEGTCSNVVSIIGVLNLCDYHYTAARNDTPGYEWAHIILRAWHPFEVKEQ